MSKSLFVECYSKEDKEKLLSCNFTFLEDISSQEKFIFFNDGKFDFSDSDIDVKLHSNANI